MLVAVFGEHVASAFLVEAVQHHAAKAGDRAHFMHGETREFIDRRDVLQAAREGARERVHRGEHVAGPMVRHFQFDDQVAVMAMDRDVELLGACGCAFMQRIAGHAEIKRRLIEFRGGNGVCDALRRRHAEQRAQRLSEQRLDGLADQRREVIARLQDAKVVGHRQQITVWLDAARNVDRLGVAIAVRDARFKRTAARFLIG